MTYKQRTDGNGFTIVELLIVIVVIGILAALTVVAYNGVTERSRTTAQVSTVRQLDKAFSIAKQDISMDRLRSAIPFFDDQWRVCLGTGYPDKNNNGFRECVYYTTPDPNDSYENDYIYENDELNDLMDNFSTLPSMESYPTVTATDGMVYHGPSLISMNIGDITALVVEYQLQGLEKNCNHSPLVYYTSSASASRSTSGNSTYSASNDGITKCAYVVVDDMYEGMPL